MLRKHLVAEALPGKILPVEDSRTQGFNPLQIVAGQTVPALPGDCLVVTLRQDVCF